MQSRYDVQRIKKLYVDNSFYNEFEFKENPLDCIYRLRDMEGGMTNISREEIQREELKYRPKCILLQFNIPEDQQDKFLASFKSQKGVNGSIYTLCASTKLPFGELANCHNYAGYWEYSRYTDGNSGFFVPCDPVLKQSFLDKLKLNNSVQVIDENQYEMNEGEARFEI